MENASSILDNVLIYTYVIASGDMRYIEINERQIYLIYDPVMAYYLRGEMPGCGAGCYADLSQIFLEYVLSCEGCRDSAEAQASTVQFGTHLGRNLALRLAECYSDFTAPEQLSAGLECAFNSLNVAFIVERRLNSLHYSIEWCPICQSADHSGLSRAASAAHHGLVAFLHSLVETIAPDWRLSEPPQVNFADPLLSIVIDRSE